VCGRASLNKNEKELEQRFQAQFYQEDIARYNPLPSFNIAPTHRHPVRTNRDPVHLLYYRWGLVPFWASDAKTGYKMINARVESVSEKPAFREAFRKRRCLVPFDGFYEWMKLPDGSKQPYHVRVDDGAIFSVAGLWEEWRGPDGLLLPTFTLITIPPNGLMARIHDRMPAILLPEQEGLWLADDLSGADLLQLLIPFPDERMVAWPVSPRVGNVRENDAGLSEAIGPALRV
jgi:putative SOS response-associated peptidase YedK